jgi:hypothetical protein
LGVKTILWQIGQICLKIVVELRMERERERERETVEVGYSDLAGSPSVSVKTNCLGTSGRVEIVYFDRFVCTVHLKSCGADTVLVTHIKKPRRTRIYL